MSGWLWGLVVVCALVIYAITRLPVSSAKREAKAPTKRADDFVSNVDSGEPLPSLAELQHRLHEKDQAHYENLNNRGRRKWDIDLKRVNQINDPRSRVRKHRATDSIEVKKYSDYSILDELDDSPAIVSDHVRFSYRDRDGLVTPREVDVQRATREYFEGYCRLRRAPRTFRYDGVRGKITRLDTGELLTPKQWRDEIL